MWGLFPLFVCLFVLLVTRFLPCLPSLALLTRHTALNSHLSLFIIFTYFVSVFAVKPRSYRLMTFTDVFVISLRSLFFKAFSSSLLSLTDSLQHMQPLASLSFSLSRTHTHRLITEGGERKKENKRELVWVSERGGERKGREREKDRKKRDKESGWRGPWGELFILLHDTWGQSTSLWVTKLKRERESRLYESDMPKRILTPVCVCVSARVHVCPAAYCPLSLSCATYIRRPSKV